MQLYLNGGDRCYLDKDIDVVPVFGKKILHYFKETDLEGLAQVEGAEPLIEGIKKNGIVVFTDV